MPCPSGRSPPTCELLGKLQSSAPMFCSLEPRETFTSRCITASWHHVGDVWCLKSCLSKDMLLRKWSNQLAPSELNPACNHVEDCIWIPLNNSPMKWICCSPMKWVALCHFIGTTAVIYTHHIHDLVGFHFIIFRLGCPKTSYKLPPFWRNVGIQRRKCIL